MSAELNELKCREEEWDFRILSNRLLMKRTDRPDEWAMDALAAMALALEARVKELEDREFNRTEQEGRDLDIQRLLI
tara:strand:- start:215 stop:445 length:231 start_codon:yes stop_codon:yes gene_type:complete